MHRFDGASGPLTEGVNHKKMIIGPDHGSLGRIIEEHHLGYTFESENVLSLHDVIKTALEDDFSYDETADEYRNSLSPDTMRKQYESLFDQIG